MQEIYKLTQILLDEIANQVKNEAIDQLTNGNFWPPAKGKGAYYEGMLAKSGKVIKQNTMKGSWMRTVEFSSPYAYAIEYGRPAGIFPPRRPLYRWFRLKMGLSKTEARQATYKLVQHMFKFGTPPRPFFTRACDKVEAQLERINDKMWKF